MFKLHVGSGLFASVFLMTSPAFAYVGPGAGITMLGALWGVLVAVVLALTAVLYLPLRTVLRKRKARRQHASEPALQRSAGPADDRTSQPVSRSR